MAIESEFTHRGFPVRLKYRGGVGAQAIYHLFILTDQGPYFDTASSIFQAKFKAVELINGWLVADWPSRVGAVQSTTSDGDDIRRIGSARRDQTEEASTDSARSA